MNNDLLKRIDEALGQFGISTDEFDLLADCRAEIERLSKPYVPMTDDELAKFWENDYSKSLVDALGKLQAEFIKRAGLEIKHD